MKSSLVALTALSLANGNTSDSLRRRLSFEKIAGYAPATQVTDHCAIDLDQQAIELELVKRTQQSLEAAQRIYNEGGSSKSYAEITLATPLLSDVQKGTPMAGITADGTETVGNAYDLYVAGTTEIRMQYQTSDDQSNYVHCAVGSLPPIAQTKDGCLIGAGIIGIDGTGYSYQYDPINQNKNGRTIAGFSTSAGEKMRLSCDGCPYTDHDYFFQYYGMDDYGHQWVTAAFNGQETQFENGNADFSLYGMDGKVEAIKKGTVYLNIFMYVIREFEDALDDCEKGCATVDCNNDPVNAWDEGVCFYTGSIEAQDGLTSEGNLLHQLADKRCADFKTCGKNGDQNQGVAKLNYDLFQFYALGKFQLQTGKCDDARVTVREITKLLYVPFIQGTLRYAYKVSELNDTTEKSKAEGAVFAAAVLPRIFAINEEHANVIYSNMRVGALSTNFAKVKQAFEYTYKEIGITCADVGGVWNEALGEYYKGAEPCVDESEDSREMASIYISRGCFWWTLPCLHTGIVLFLDSGQGQ
ncbi:unnamed protein product [Cylindrotheca closterium]|uniref:Uncharacterized protein n=1 Tax=Cylindrotheca closterium TaxID=2856 RepID=A0AAD2FPS1_9STRA|nr:unnamed protein product [Cylindrotheca closterium]